MIGDRLLAANEAYTKDFGDKAKLPMSPAPPSPSLPAWTRGLTLPSSQATARATRPSSGTPAAARATTPSAPSLSPTSCSAPRSVFAEVETNSGVSVTYFLVVQRRASAYGVAKYKQPNLPHDRRRIKRNSRSVGPQQRKIRTGAWLQWSVRNRRASDSPLGKRCEANPRDYQPFSRDVPTTWTWRSGRSSLEAHGAKRVQALGPQNYTGNGI